MKKGLETILGLGTIFALITLYTNSAGIKAFAQEKINQYFYVSSCDTPINYTVGTIDPRFGVTKTQFLADIQKAETIWDNTEDNKLFEYNPGSQNSLTINLVFDQRQQLNTRVNNLKNQVGEANQSLKPQISQYNQEKTSLEKQLSDLNNQINSWNQKGGAPPDEYQQLLQEQNDLKTEADKLNQEAKQLNLSTQAYNTDVFNLNHTINTYNEVLLKKPEEGLFNPNTNSINIYFDNSYSELIHTLAHEMGHSLGLGHNQNQKSIMYPYTNQVTTPSADDTKALDLVCQTRYLNLPWISPSVRY